MKNLKNKVKEFKGKTRNLVGIQRLNHRAGKYIMMFWAQGQSCAILRVIVNYSEIKEHMD